MGLKVERALRDPYGLFPNDFGPGEEVVRVSDSEYALVLPAAVFDDMDEVALRTVFEARKEQQVAEGVVT